MKDEEIDVEIIYGLVSNLRLGVFWWRVMITKKPQIDIIYFFFNDYYNDCRFFYSQLLMNDR